MNPVGKGPMGDGGNGRWSFEGSYRFEVDGGKNPYLRNKDDTAMKQPVLPIPAEQFTMIGGSESNWSRDSAG